MPLDTETGMTYGDILARVAARTNHTKVDSDGKLTPPSNAQTLAIMKDAVGSAIEYIYRKDPSWSFMRRELQIVLDPTGSAYNAHGGTNHTYILPAYVRSGPLADFYISNPVTSQYSVRPKTWEHVSRQLAQSDNSGEPAMYALRTDPETGRWLVRFYPKPALSRTVAAPFYIPPPKPVDLDQRHHLGAQHDELIIEVAAAKFVQTDEENRGMAAELMARADAAIEEAKRMDKQNRITAFQATDTAGSREYAKIDQTITKIVTRSGTQTFVAIAPE